MNSAEFAEKSGYSISTICRLVREEKIKPAAKAPGLRGAYLFDPAEVERLKAVKGGDAA